ncbi:potassium channel family protein [Alkalicoccus chagannorensis]|uniref:potassium channel family protein n=1 Tax=Alkalicoccus chagannorensis TaxID=427072 RepID=UPI00040FC488|nr:potassium channel family protein [Alkalicoccus chagannorensis]
MSLLLVGAGILVIIGHFVYFLKQRRFRESRLNLGLFLHMFFLLTAVTITFSFLYFYLGTQGTTLRVNDPTDEPVDVTFLEALYFSGVTILSVGYGDYVPIGPARFFALIQAALGLLIPSAFFLTALGQEVQNKQE